MPESPPSLRLFGPPGLARAGGTAPLPLERKDAALLAVLALHGPMARDTLAEWLWPEVPLKRANLSLRQRVFRLRRKAGHELVRTGATLALAEGVTTDAHAPAGAPVELLAGLLFADCPALSEWLRLQRERFALARRDALAQAAAAHEEQGELAAAIDIAQALRAEDPLSDHAVRRLMRLHYLRGDRTAAVAVFERFEQQLKHELGARPDPETVALLGTVEAEQAPPPSAPRRTPVPASLLRPPRLVGRATELTGLADAWEAGRVPLLLGEAGMGKTRLLSEFARSRPELLLVQARPGDAGVPYALLARWLRAVQQRCALVAEGPHAQELSRVLPQWGAGQLAVGEGQRLRLQSAVEWLLQRAADHGVKRTLLDDLHFADEASLELLQSLLCSDRLAEQQWCLAMRPGDGPPAATALLGALQEDQRLSLVALKPLDQAAVRELLDSLALPGLDATGLAPLLLRHTGGNPLFLLETLKDLVLHGAGGGRLPQPSTVGTLIERRLRALSAAALALARVAAVAGVDFDIDLASTVTGKPALDLADAWAELEAAQVLAGGVFAHDLVFDAVLRTLPEVIARHVHAGVAQALQERATEPARVAEHWHEAQRWSAAARAFEQASQQARRAGRLGEARSLWQRAVDDHGRADEPSARLRCEIQGVELVLTTAGPDAALELATRLLADPVSEAQRVELLSLGALAHLYAGRAAQALALGQQAVERATALGQPALALDAERVCGQAESLLGRADRGVARLQGMLTLAATAGTARQHYEATAALAYALNQNNQLGESARALVDTIRLAAQAGDLAEVMISRRNLAAIELMRGYADSALEQSRAADLLAGHADAPQGPHEAHHAMTKGAAALLAGQYTEAQAWLEAAQQGLLGTSPALAAVAGNHLATLWLQLGQWHRVAPLLAGDEPTADIRHTLALRRLTLRARLARGRGGTEPAALAEQLQQGLARLQGSCDERQLAAWRLELSRVLPTEAALAAVREVRDFAVSREMDGLALHAAVREVDLMRTLDPSHADTLAARLRARPPGLYLTDGHLPELWLVCARVAQACARPDEVRALLRQAIDWIDHAAAMLAPALRRAFIEEVGVHVELRQWLRRHDSPA